MALGLPTLLVQEGGYALKHIGRCAVALLRPFHARSHAPALCRPPRPAPAPEQLGKGGRPWGDLDQPAAERHFRPAGGAGGTGGALGLIGRRRRRQRGHGRRRSAGSGRDRVTTVETYTE